MVELTEEAKKEIVCVVECPEGFNDFSIVKQYVPPGGRVEVSEGQFRQMRQSQPSVVCVQKRLPLDSEAAKRIAEAEVERQKVKDEIKEKYEKDAPPRRKVGKAPPPPFTDTRRPVSPVELIDLPVTKDE